MRNLQILAAVAAMLCAGAAKAATPAEACANLGEARAQLVAMLGEADATKLDGYKAKIQAASKALDANLAAMAGGPDAARRTPSSRCGRPSRRRARPRSFPRSMPATRRRRRASPAASRLAV